MFYIVTGHPRSGTSMMMSALFRGGMSIEYCKLREHNMTLLNDGHFIANKFFYEINFKEYDYINFPYGSYKNKAITVFYWGLPNLKVAKYKIIFMKRKYQEIKESWNRIFKDRNPMKITDETSYDVTMSKYIDLMNNRKDVELTVLNYSDVVSDPMTVFKSLDWPVDPKRCVKAINKNLYRSKFE